MRLALLPALMHSPKALYTGQDPKLTLWRTVSSSAFLVVRHPNLYCFTNLEIITMRRFLCRLLPIALLAALALTAPQSALAADRIPHYDACASFDVTISGTGGNQAVRMTRVKDGIIYTIVAGRGTTLTVGNFTTGKTVTFDTKGSVTRTAENTETGTIDFALSGANLVLLFKADAGGPSTILYTGLVKFTATSDDFTLVEPIEQVSGTQRDICAELQ